MLFSRVFVTFLGVASARSVKRPSQQVFPSHGDVEDATLRIPSVHESTVMARRIMHLTTLGTLISTFPEEESTSYPGGTLGSLENRPSGMVGNPIGLMEYYADCEPSTGNPTLLAINIATPYKNYAAGSNISLHLRWWPQRKNTYASAFSWFWDDDDDDDDEIPTPHTPAALPRFSLHGRLEAISRSDLKDHSIPACFLRAHPDSVLWQPGNDIHTSEYMRLVVDHVYWFGGFGDRARIGWLPIEGWRNVTMDEVTECRLPGEQRGRGNSRGWRDWL